MLFTKIISRIKSAIYGLLRKLGILCEVHYIGGAETLPPPLTAEEETDILSRLDEDESLRRVLVERNLRLVVYIARKFENTGVGLEDLISIGTIGLIKAANTFRADKNIKLATYASRCIENEILMYIRKSQNQKLELSLEAPLSADWDGNELILSDVLGSDEENVGKRLEDEEEKSVIAEAVALLGDREREIIELRFGLGGRREMTQKEVADMLGISQSYISRLEKKTINRLKEQIENKI
ncbi:MAG: RNA polymerase sporulation sigma factor SigE [Eubacteriales bacterium]|mgnify:FL=1|nr:RNA polymerase sporulation sigma factor SigE [Eubacteriales bacterium]MCI6972226.1 RNA polymerase sporulation sigma factor SigE [Eubacterium sp.]MDY5356007.1 RNA polymerase sporulation sigma factor SigE [Eubacteriales bacterium]